MTEQTAQTIEIPKTSFYMNKTLRSNLGILYKGLREDWDCCIVIDGWVGSGKSVLGMQIAKFFDPNFNVNKIVYKPEQFKVAVQNAEPYSVIMFDEAIRGLYARGSMAKQNKEIVVLLNECRQKNLALILVLPSVFDLDRSIVLHRANCLLHVTSRVDRENLDRVRGYFGFYGPGRLKKLYIAGKKFYDYKARSPRYVRKFPHVYVVDEEAYREYKRVHFVSERFGDGEEEAEELQGPPVDIFI